MRVRALGEALHRAGELLARREQQGEVVQPGVTAAGRGTGLLDEHEEVLAARAHRRDLAVAVVQLQAERALVERDRTAEVRDGEVDGPEAQRVRKPRGERRIGRSAHDDDSKTGGKECNAGKGAVRGTLPALGAMAQLAEQPVSKTGGSRFESWLPR